MMLRLILVLALILGLHGCATFSLDGPPPISQLDSWMDKHQYGKVLNVLSKVPQNHPDYIHYAARRNIAEERARIYEDSILKDVSKAEEKQDWPNAIATIDTALDNYPESLRLSQKRVELIGHQQRRAKVLSAEALLARANWLENELPLRKQQSKRAPVDISLQWSLNQVENEIKKTRAKLIATATDMFKYGELDIVDRCLQQARKFKPSANDIKTIALLEDRLAVRRDDIKRKRLAKEARQSIQHSTALKKKRTKRINSLLKKTNRAIQKNDLITARKNIEVLNRIAADHPEVIRLDAYISARIDTLVKQMSDKGSMLYRQEKIEPAREVWQEALALDPDNKKLRENIDRATRVLKKLERLRKQQTPG